GRAVHDDGVLPLASTAVDHRRGTLPNGLRILVAEMPETRSVSMAVYVGVGSRVESKVDAGTSHFLEHMVFKGTAKRPTAADISQEIESRGGVVNASTDKEVTVFWSRVVARHYLVALAGPLDADEAIAAVEAALGGLAPREPAPIVPAPKAGKPRAKLLGKRAEQTNLCVGWRTVQTDHPDKFAVDMLNAVLGEGMSSRLFLELREKRGLAYDVHSYDANYVDAWHLVVYAGFAPQNGAEVLATILREIDRMRDEP